MRNGSRACNYSMRINLRAISEAIDSSLPCGSFRTLPTHRRSSSYKLSPLDIMSPRDTTRTGERREWERCRRSVPLYQIQVVIRASKTLPHWERSLNCIFVFLTALLWNNTNIKIILKFQNLDLTNIVRYIVRIWNIVQWHLKLIKLYQTVLEIVKSI